MASESTAGVSQGSKPRQRAAVACTSCRRKRVKCVTIDGAFACDHCMRVGLDCIYHQEDSYTRSTNDIFYKDNAGHQDSAQTMVETQIPNPAPESYAPFSDWSTNELSSLVEQPAEVNSERPLSPRLSQTYSASRERVSMGSIISGEGGDLGYSGRPIFGASPADSSRSQTHSASSESSEELVERLLSTTGYLGHDSTAGAKRYFGPTTNLHVHANSPAIVGLRRAAEPQRRTAKVVNELSVEAHDHLMACFWRHHNSIFRVVERDEFTKCKEDGGTIFFSSFLQLCMLALGYRFADKSRPEIQRLRGPHSPLESTLHREAKRLVEYELEHLGGIPLVQSLLLLGDLECGCGRDNTGWMFGGMAFRLCYDMGLNRDCSFLGLPPNEIKVRRTVLWACVVYDQYWALYLGRFTTIKTSDIEVQHLPYGLNCSKINDGQRDNNSTTVELLTYDALLSLMEISAKLTGDAGAPSVASQQQACLRLNALDRELKEWAERLPSCLHWKWANIATARPPFFLLHQQYHTSMALLHRPFAHLKRDIRRPGNEAGVKNLAYQTRELSLSIYLEHADRVVRVLKEHCKRFEISQFCLNTLHHIGTAATACIFGATLGDHGQWRRDIGNRLQFLTKVLYDLSETYQPAQGMFDVLKRVLPALKWGDTLTRPNDDIEESSSQVPRRRWSSTLPEAEREGKRRRLFDSPAYMSSELMAKKLPNFESREMTRINMIDIESVQAEALLNSMQLPLETMSPAPNLCFPDASDGIFGANDLAQHENLRVPKQVPAQDPWTENSWIAP